MFALHALKLNCIFWACENISGLEIFFIILAHPCLQAMQNTLILKNNKEIKMDG